MSQSSGVAAGHYTELPVNRKPSETVTVSILGLLLRTNQGKQLSQSDYRLPILAGLAGIGAGVASGQPNVCLRAIVLAVSGYS